MQSNLESKLLKYVAQSDNPKKFSSKDLADRDVRNLVILYGKKHLIDIIKTLGKNFFKNSVVLEDGNRRYNPIRIPEDLVRSKIHMRLMRENVTAKIQDYIHKYLTNQTNIRDLHNRLLLIQTTFANANKSHENRQSFLNNLYLHDDVVRVHFYKVLINSKFSRMLNMNGNSGQYFIDMKAFKHVFDVKDNPIKYLDEYPSRLDNKIISKIQNLKSVNEFQLHKLFWKIIKHQLNLKSFKHTDLMAARPEYPYKLNNKMKMFDCHSHALLANTDESELPKLSKLIQHVYKLIFGYNFLRAYNIHNEPIPIITPVKYKLSQKQGEAPIYKPCIVSNIPKDKVTQHSWFAIDNFIKYMFTDYHLQIKDTNYKDFMKQSKYIRKNVINAQLTVSKGQKVALIVSRATLSKQKKMINKLRAKLQTLILKIYIISLNYVQTECKLINKSFENQQIELEKALQVNSLIVSDFIHILVKYLTYNVAKLNQQSTPIIITISMQSAPNNVEKLQLFRCKPT